jgi:hypothetical protein
MSGADRGASEGRPRRDCTGRSRRLLPERHPTTARYEIRYLQRRVAAQALALLHERPHVRLARPERPASRRRPLSHPQPSQAADQQRNVSLPNRRPEAAAPGADHHGHDAEQGTRLAIDLQRRGLGGRGGLHGTNLEARPARRLVLDVERPAATTGAVNRATLCSGVGRLEARARRSSRGPLPNLYMPIAW